MCAVVDVQLSLSSCWHCEESDCENVVGKSECIFKLQISSSVAFGWWRMHVLIGFTEQTKGSCTCQESE